MDSIITDPPYEMGFMGKLWDSTGIANDIEMWKLCVAILKPGGHLLSFGGARTYHRMACAIEDAGFQIRDQIMWVYGSGFPKNLNLGDGFGTALKPAHEPIVLARKPLSEKNIASNVLKHGVGGLNIDGCRVGNEERINPAFGVDGWRKLESRQDRQQSIASNVHGRFPANLIHDGSKEVEAEFAKAGNRGGKWGRQGDLQPTSMFYGHHADNILQDSEKFIGDTGSASRFFYCAKASKKERDGSKHPTVKPLALMRYLCRLITPPAGTILDQFAGTGTTGQAAKEEGFKFILIEKEKEYYEDMICRFS